MSKWGDVGSGLHDEGRSELDGCTIYPILPEDRRNVSISITKCRKLYVNVVGSVGMCINSGYRKWHEVQNNRNKIFKFGLSNQQ
jgi:hypothetical protein